MVVGGRRCTVYFLAAFLALLKTSLLLANGEAFDHPSIAKPPVFWTNNVSDYIWEVDKLTLQPILISGDFVCGFHCEYGENDTCFFAISIFIYTGSFPDSQMVWSANRNNPVGDGTKLLLSQQGDLMLQNVDSTLIWSTNTTGKSVSGLQLTHQAGKLVLFDGNNKTVWQSFDHPTDSLVLGQRLVSGQKLVASMSYTNWSEGLYSFSIDNNGYFVASAELDATIVYYQSNKSKLISQTGQFYAELTNISSGIGLSSRSGVSFIQLGSDGHLFFFSWTGSRWTTYDLFENQVHECDYPLACGNYGICSAQGCSCPTYFKQRDSNESDLRCSPYIPVSCEFPYQHSLLELKHVDYVPGVNYHITEIKSCKQACLKNCSCKYVAFRISGFKPPTGLCTFGSEALSFKRDADTNNNPSVFLKVVSSSTEQIPQKDLPSPRKRRQNVEVILGSTLASTFGVLLICAVLLLQTKKDPKDVEQDYIGHISGLPTRFSYEELKVATNNFSNKLGEGGFGCVFQGTLPCGAQIAVKCLDGFGSVKKSFITEVETIGSIHHFNLVRLVGFCAEKSRMLLVYEYMCNGSLDQWIFCRDKALSLGWQCRRKIILDIANGLAYLHGGCRQKIIHLDIKPQNILLNENLNAKVSDFGLPKLVGREQSQIVTTMRGTPGYMAPEWLNSAITEKVDVYSLGIVVLEILCGRKNVDRSLPEEDAHLVSLFKRKVEDGQLLDLVDKSNEEMQSNTAEIVEMMKVAAWCLQGEYARRPSMSMVVKFIEGKMDDENECDFSNPPAPAEVETLGNQMDAAAVTASPLIPSILSGPR